MASKGVNFIIDLVIYPYDIWFSIGETDKWFISTLNERLQDEYMSDLKEDDICHMSAECRGRTYHHLIGGQTIIRLPKKPRTAQEFGTLAHEIFHAVDFITRRIGLRLGIESDEAYAYLIGYITERVYEKLT